MTLRFRILVTGGFLHYGIAVIALIVSLGNWIGVCLATLWVVIGGYVLRKKVMPELFPYARCHHCGTVINLKNRWSCGGKDGHYVSGEPHHILDFHCNKGHELGSFKCPECRTSILIRWMNRSVYRNGEPLDEFPSDAPQGNLWWYGFSRLWKRQRATGQQLFLGSDLRFRCSRLRRTVLRLLKQSIDNAVWIPEWVVRRHIFIIGGTGSGKSNAIENMAAQVFESGGGAAFLDPTGDLSANLLKLVPENRQQDVYYINVMDEEHPFPINVFKTNDKAEQKALIDELLEMLEHLNSGSWGKSIAFLLRKAFRLVMEIGGSFQDVYDLFTDPDARVRLARQSKQRDLKMFWLEEFPSIPYAKRAAVVPKLDEIVFHPFLRPILCTRECLFDADKIIRKKKIVIVNLFTGSASDQTNRILGACLFTMILAAVTRQGRLKPGKRVPFFFVIDEAQRFMSRANALNTILSEYRKYKLTLVLANQYLGQLLKEAYDAIMGNVKCVLCFCIGSNDAPAFKKLLGASEKELTNLSVGTCIAKIGNSIYRVQTPRSRVAPEEIAKRPSDTEEKLEAKANEIIALNHERISAVRSTTENTSQETSNTDTWEVMNNEEDCDLLPVFGAAVPRNAKETR